MRIEQREKKLMVKLSSRNPLNKLYSLLPIILLIVSVLNEFDFNYLQLDYFSFNFPFILIFFFTLKDFKHFDYLVVFISGLINDQSKEPISIISFRDFWENFGIS